VWFHFPIFFVSNIFFDQGFRNTCQIYVYIYIYIYIYIKSVIVLYIEKFQYFGKYNETSVCWPNYSNFRNCWINICLQTVKDDDICDSMLWILYLQFKVDRKNETLCRCYENRAIDKTHWKNTTHTERSGTIM